MAVQQKQKRSNSARNAKNTEKMFETDSAYFLKLVLFALLGTLWVKFSTPMAWVGIPVSGVPLGFLAGLVLVNRFEKHQSDRKIWYAILLVITIICYFVPAGLVI